MLAVGRVATAERALFTLSLSYLQLFVLLQQIWLVNCFLLLSYFGLEVQIIVVLCHLQSTDLPVQHHYLGRHRKLLLQTDANAGERLLNLAVVHFV